MKPRLVTDLRQAVAEAHAGRAFVSPASPIRRLFLASALTATSTCFTSATRIEVSTRESPAQLQVLPRRHRSADRSPLGSVSKCTSSRRLSAFHPVFGDRERGLHPFFCLAPHLAADERPHETVKPIRSAAIDVGEPESFSTRGIRYRGLALRWPSRSSGWRTTSSRLPRRGTAG